MKSKRRVINFGAGPAMLPDEVILKAQEELHNWQGTGLSVLEMSHRGDEFQEIILQTKGSLKRLLQLPDEYEILLLQGGARLQFSMIPMNYYDEPFLPHYFISGYWSTKSFEEASFVQDGTSSKIISNKSPFKILATDQWKYPREASYYHLTLNETIDGVEISSVPEDLNGKLIADVSSTLLSRPFDVRPYKLIYACAQKNLGCAGLTFVILNKESIPLSKKKIPRMLSYEEHIFEKSLLNTSPTFSVYISSLMFKWIEAKGGLDYIYKEVKRKAKILYSCIDSSDF
tara:strand:- start:305 stop:1165 length:861 start_codon:yes stop_codon:yes gene_type:complete